MIRFTSLKWKNFLSTGNVFTEIKLDRSPTTLVTGENGAGKSTMLDALCFVLFGKPFRNINKPQLMNSINNKDCVVEIEFSVGGNDYLVRRGIKPVIFDVYKNGNLLDQPGNSRDYQSILEETILKLNYKSFTQIVILGSASFTPFMQLSARDRREVIEDLLDIQIFSNMNVLLKDRVAKNKQETAEVTYQVDMSQEKIDIHKEYLEKVKSDIDDQVKTLEEEITQYNGVIEAKQNDVNSTTQQIQDYGDLTEKHTAVSEKSTKVFDLLQKLSDKQTKANKRIQFFKLHDNCPTCEQQIDETIKSNKIEKTQDVLTKTEDALSTLRQDYASVQSKLLDITEQQKTVASLQNKISALQAEINTNNLQIKKTREKIKTLQNTTSREEETETKLSELQQELKINKEKKKTLIVEKELYEYASTLLKDGGIKSKIIRQYVPIMNKLINKYLAALDFFVNFELDEEFNEVIRSRHRDEFSYSSFSEGEKMRIDLALLFTWRAIAKLKNSTNTNLLILDEVFDASLDTAGCDEFLKLLQEVGLETNVFVISHKGDVLQDKFRSHIRFEKVKNFSRMAV